MLQYGCCCTLVVPLLGNVRFGKATLGLGDMLHNSYPRSCNKHFTQIPSSQSVCILAFLLTVNIRGRSAPRSLTRCLLKSRRPGPSVGPLGRSPWNNLGRTERKVCFIPTILEIVWMSKEKGGLITDAGDQRGSSYHGAVLDNVPIQFHLVLKLFKYLTKLAKESRPLYVANAN